MNRRAGSPQAGVFPGRRPATVAVLAILLVAWGVARGAELPQDHPYQVTLRDHLATLEERDFAVALQPVVIDPKGLADDESVHRLWVLANDIPATLGLRIAAERFTLRAIESPGGILMRIGESPAADPSGVAIQPQETLWWAAWDHPANPYRGSPAVRRRAFVAAAVDMIMLDHLHESGNDWVKNARRSDFLGASLIWMAHVYRDCRGDLPEPVREAYATGLKRLVDRLNEWGPTAVNDDMDLRAVTAMAYVVDAFGEGEIVDSARQYVQRVLRLIHPCGMIRDAGGLEASYNGIALFAISEAVAVAAMPEVVDVQRRMSDLKAHLTFPEPDGVTFHGPSEFSTRTSADVTDDQWCMSFRDISIAMRTDEALYLMFGGKKGRVPGCMTPDRDTMWKAVRKNFGELNAALRPETRPFLPWTAVWWGSRRTNHAYDHYVPGFHDRLRSIQRKGHPLAITPAMRVAAGVQPPTIRAFPEVGAPGLEGADAHGFLVASFPNYSAVISTVPLGWTKDYRNLGGGALSAFWTPKGGSMLLGRGALATDAEKSQRRWQDWRLWSSHAIAGETASGKAFSSARLRGEVMTTETEIGDRTATVVVSGLLGKAQDGGRTVEDGCLEDDVRYGRRFDVSADGVVVETTLDGPGTASVNEVCEIIPLFVGEREGDARQSAARGSGHRVRFIVGGKPIDPGDRFVDGVEAVEVERFGGQMWVQFERPSRVRLGDPWVDTYQSRAEVRNLLVDLVGGASRPVALESFRVRYRLRAVTPGNAPRSSGVRDAWIRRGK